MHGKGPHLWIPEYATALPPLVPRLGRCPLGLATGTFFGPLGQIESVEESLRLPRSPSPIPVKPASVVRHRGTVARILNGQHTVFDSFDFSPPKAPYACDLRTRQVLWTAG